MGMEISAKMFGRSLRDDEAPGLQVWLVSVHGEEDRYFYETDTHYEEAGRCSQSLDRLKLQLVTDMRPLAVCKGLRTQRRTTIGLRSRKNRQLHAGSRRSPVGMETTTEHEMLGRTIRDDEAPGFHQLGLNSRQRGYYRYKRKRRSTREPIMSPAASGRL